MEPAPLRFYRLEFAKRAEWRREDERRAFDQFKQKQKDERKQEREREAEQGSLADMALMVLATEAEIADFNVKLDTYDTATVEALIENEEALMRVREQVRLMLDQAYVLPDGRKVFKTEDGTRIFDEQGQEVTDFDPDLIEDWRPHHEAYQAIVEQEAALEHERKDLVEFQEKLDEARDAAGAEGITKAELDDLEKRLEESAPDAVKRKLATDGPEPDTARRHETEFRPVGKLDMPTF